MSADNSPCDADSNSDPDSVEAPLFFGYPTRELLAQSLVDGRQFEGGAVETGLPVRGEPFCTCYESGGDSDNCCCGEEDTVFDWSWEDRHPGSAVLLTDHNRSVRFHPDFSSGTAAVKGNKAMKDGQHYWEVKMTTHVYGTDMMIGVGTANVDLNRYHHTFTSFLGEDADSWGISYTGHLHHNGNSLVYTKKFGQGTVIGVHLDMWRGTMEYYMNRKPLGLAFTGLGGKAVHPMACSTAARSGMKLIRSCSFRSTLQLLCCQALRQFIPKHLSVLEAITLPPGLRAFLVNNMSWLLWARGQERGRKHSSSDGEGPSTSSKAKRLKSEPMTDSEESESS